MDLGPHAAFIWLAYAIVAVVVGLLIVWLIADGRKQASEIEALQKRGIRRHAGRGEQGA